MKSLIQLVVAIILLSITTLYANATIYNKSNKTEKVEEFVKDFSVGKLVEKEVQAIEEEKAEIELKKERERAIKVSRGTPRSVPKTDTSMKSYMNFKAITNKSSAQYKLQQRDDVWTDEEGFRRLGDKYIIAVGTHYAEEIGIELVVELSSGTVFEAVVGDIKDNRHTDSTNRQHRVDGSVIEFIVDTNKLDKTIKKMGDCSYSSMNDFKGDVVNIIVLPKDE